LLSGLFVGRSDKSNPIFTQQTIHVNHAFSATDMMRAGKEIDTAVLAKALQVVFNDRMFVYKIRALFLNSDLYTARNMLYIFDFPVRMLEIGFPKSKKIAPVTPM
jgi:hypothetical protein